ncbi:hypothetical protein [Vibrio parahaemolyticus]|uniref:hypothetical protein n=1 Tax=Vibrio parahaemolyticus TaxID=670 RepID=UPI00111CD966|nr:hypothetical protein [Vibrio parahaemolyticus]
MTEYHKILYFACPETAYLPGPDYEEWQTAAAVICTNPEQQQMGYYNKPQLDLLDTPCVCADVTGFLFASSVP